VTVVAAGALLASGCSLPGQVEGPVELTAIFDDVGDLVAGHSVQVADVRVGSVVAIDLTDDFRARVTMKIKDDLELPVDTEAVLRTTSLLGEKFIELKPPVDLAGQPLRQAPFLVDGTVVGDTSQAPELEFVAQEAVEVLGGVISSDLSTLIETGSVAFGGRAAELGSVLDSLSVVTSTLADQTTDIVAIIDGLDQASATLAGGSERIDALLVNLARTSEVLADNRELTLQTLRDLTRLATAQNDIVFEPFRDDIQRQIEQLDAILAVVADQRGEVGVLVDWLARFADTTPKGIPGDFAQVYAWFELALLGEAP
jgi:phospholipid/cholesterol/gamma-HCH transport system substrate-binding protein